MTGDGAAMSEDAAVAGWDTEEAEHQAESTLCQPGSGQPGQWQRPALYTRNMEVGYFYGVGERSVMGYSESAVLRTARLCKSTL